MRVVYDTNVLATLLSRRGEILRLKHAITTNEIILVTSPFILDELEAVLRSKFGLTKKGAKARTRLLARIAEVVEPENIEKVARDTDDDHILAAAVTAKASFIITLDNDLLVLKQYKNVKIITPETFKPNKL